MMRSSLRNSPPTRAATAKPTSLRGSSRTNFTAPTVLTNETGGSSSLRSLDTCNARRPQRTCDSLDGNDYHTQIDVHFNGMNIDHQLDLVLNHVDTPKQAKTTGKAIHRNEQRTVPKRVLGFLRRTSHHGGGTVTTGRGASDCGNVGNQFKQAQSKDEHMRASAATRPSTRSLQHTMKQHDLDLVVPAHTSRATGQHGTNSKDWVGSILVVPHMVDSDPSQPPRQELHPKVADETCRVSSAIAAQRPTPSNDLPCWSSRSRPSATARRAPAHRGEDIALTAPMRQPSMTDDDDDSDNDAASFVDMGVAFSTTRLCKQRKKKNLFDSSTSATTDQEQSLSPYTTESVDDDWRCDAINLDVGIELNDHQPFDQADSIRTIEIAPGYSVPFRGVEETMVYIATDATTMSNIDAASPKNSRYIASNTCWTCTTLVHHIADVAYVFCPVCRTLQPTTITDTVDSRAAAGTSETSGCWGVGLGFLTDDWKTWKADFLAS